MKPALSIWVVYANPSDFPGMFVARRFENEKPTADKMVSNDITVIRDFLEDLGLVYLARFPDDDPVILETWL